MSAVQAVLVVGGSLAVLAVMIAVMIRLERAQRQRILRRREAWKAGGDDDAGPDDYIGRGPTFNFGR